MAKTVRVMLGAPLFPFSSTEVRERLRNGGSVDDMLPQAVLERLNELQIKF
jgi:nicotinic acid mononucleotide adenylyltransferase